MITFLQDLFARPTGFLIVAMLGITCLAFAALILRVVVGRFARR